MNPKDYIEMGLNGDAPLKIILKSSVNREHQPPVGVVSVVFASTDKDSAKNKLETLAAADPASYYMVYSVPLDTNLTTLPHYPSIAITQDDLR